MNTNDCTIRPTVNIGYQPSNEITVSRGDLAKYNSHELLLINQYLNDYFRRTKQKNQVSVLTCDLAECEVILKYQINEEYNYFLEQKVLAALGFKIKIRLLVFTK